MPPKSPIPVESRFYTRATAEVPAELKGRVVQKLFDCARQLHQAGFVFELPTLSFDLRGRAAGKAIFRARGAKVPLPSPHVAFNAVLLIENPETLIGEIVGHEVAHIAVRAKFGSSARAHGAEWAATMRTLGLEPKRLHALDVTNSQVTLATYLYRCSCRTRLFSQRKHNMAQRKSPTSGASRTYTCKACDGQVTYEPRPGDLPVAKMPPRKKTTKQLARKR
jgi:predicted SprT family Zn-dependent metalloprotease